MPVQLHTALKGNSRHYGIPLTIYGGRHGVFKFNGKPRHVTQPVGPTQFTLAIGELRIEQIFARSPQARGRVARTAENFQGQLITELRLVGAATVKRSRLS